jgi:hypothetical protein
MVPMFQETSDEFNTMEIYTNYKQKFCGYSFVVLPFLIVDNVRFNRKKASWIVPPNS